jgi:nucleotide-binding universal stress UspA family protein
MTEHAFTIVVGVDFEHDGDLAFDAAVEIVRAHPSAHLHVCWVGQDLGGTLGVPLDPRVTADQAQSGLEHLRKYCANRIASLRERLGDLPIGRLATHFRTGSPAPQLVQLAADVDADLVVVGTHARRGLKRFVLGSVAAGVLSTARCTVYVARFKDHEGIGEVPEIEPPCRDCVTARRDSNGDTWWCDRHSRGRRPPAHHYGYVERTSRAPSPYGAAFD